MTTTVKRTKKAAATWNHPDLGPVEQIDTHLLRPYPGNARTHNDRQIEKIKQSLQAFGWMNPILAERDGTIIAGHGRWLAAQELSLPTCAVIRADHVTPEAARAYRLADNRLAELSGWDEDLLKIELQHLGEIDLDFNIELLGWDHAELDLMATPATSAADPADQNVILEKVAVSRPDDLWLLGKHRLLCGSALEPAAFIRLMDGQKASAVFVDAPYNVSVTKHVGGLGKTKHREFGMASGEMSETEFREFLATNAKFLSEHVIDGAILAMCMDWRGWRTLQAALDNTDLKLINLAIWVKANGGMGSLYRSQYELVSIVKKGKSRHINNVELGKHGRSRTNIWSYAGVNSFSKDRMEQLSGHPTPKPIPLVADFLRDVTHRGHIVLDSFMGSGTTLLAAERTQRIAYGMDLDPLYVDLTIRRWERMTGLTAIHADTRQTFADITEERSGG